MSYSSYCHCHPASVPEKPGTLNHNRPARKVTGYHYNVISCPCEPAITPLKAIAELTEITVAMTSRKLLTRGVGSQNGLWGLNR